MRFAFTDDQLLFRDAVRDLLEARCPPAAVRAAWDAPHDAAIDRTRWRALADMGVLGVLVPEAHGGLGLTELDLVLLLEETGRAALPEPVVDVAGVGAPLLAAVAGGAANGDDGAAAAASDQAANWVQRMVAGEALVGVQSGGKPSIAGAAEADGFVLVHGDEVHLVGADGVQLTEQQSVDGARKLCLVDWHRTTATRVAHGPAGWALVNEAFDRGALATAAQLLGLADRLLALTVDYAGQRHQFGVPIGSFQAVKHQLADATLALEFARPVVYRAAASLATGVDDPARSRDVSMAKIYAATAAHQASRVALQIHGAIGYTVEADLHLYMKRVWALEAAWGEVAWHRDRVAAAVLGGRTGGDPTTGADPTERPLGQTLA
jgi:alkylation response protein AidB-like acyl-CoA dehydrogenase